MAKVFFCNNEPIDLNAIAIMGVSVKTGDNPIGYFGTGLKFSIATLLRTGHQVVLYRNGERIEFTAEPEVIRGERFERVLMGAERLGFTTQLGRNWEPWQAYRELRCNCTDEGGVISDEKPVGADLEHIRQAATHSDIAMTQRYSRGDADKTKSVLLKRVEHRRMKRERE